MARSCAARPGFASLPALILRGVPFIPPYISIPCGVFANFLWGIGCVPRVVLRKGPINEAKVEEMEVKVTEEVGFELSTLGLQAECGTKTPRSPK